jgi:hypothetical protein
VAAPDPGSALEALAESVVERARGGGDSRRLRADIDSLAMPEIRTSTAIIERCGARGHRPRFDLDTRRAAVEPGAQAALLDQRLAELNLELAVLDQELLALATQLPALRSAARLLQIVDDRLEGHAGDARSVSVDVRSAVRTRRADVLAHLAVAEQANASLLLTRSATAALAASVSVAGATLRAARQATSPEVLQTYAQLRRRERELEALGRPATQTTP